MKTFLCAIVAMTLGVSAYASDVLICDVSVHLIEPPVTEQERTMERDLKSMVDGEQEVVVQEYYISDFEKNCYLKIFLDDFGDNAPLRLFAIINDDDTPIQAVGVWNSTLIKATLQDCE